MESSTTTSQSRPGSLVADYFVLVHGRISRNCLQHGDEDKSPN